MLTTSAQKKFIKTALVLLIVASGALLFIKYLLPCLLPFIMAFFTAWLIEPLVAWGSKRVKIPRGVCSALIILFFLVSVLGCGALIISKILYEAVGLLESLPKFFSGVPDLVERLNAAVSRFISRSPEGVRQYIQTAIDGIYESISHLPSQFSSKVLSTISAFAGSTPDIILFCATYAIGSFFISGSYPLIRSFIRRQIPTRLHDTAINIKRDLLSGLGKWLKAQITLMCATFAELTLAFIILGVEHAGIIAIVTAFIDALPVFGTGIVLLPWAILLIIGGDISRAVGILATYLIVTIVRSFLEPRLVGAQFGINPAAALLAMYSGFKLAGVFGMVLFPFGLMSLKQMNDKGYIRLWK